MLRKIGTLRICRDISDGGGSTSTIDTSQKDMLGEMLDDLNASTGDGVSFEDEIVETPEKVETVDEGLQPDEIPEKVETVVDPALADEDKEASPEDIINSLREQIMALTNIDPLVQAVQTTVTPDQVADPVNQAKAVVEEFLTADELDRLIDEPQLINLAFQRSRDSLVGSIGSLVQAEVNKQIMVSRAVSDFYTENQDLLPYAKFVQFVMTSVEKANPTKTYADIFSDTATECRKRLGLAKTPAPTRDNSQANNGQQRPAFVGSKRGNARPAAQKDFFDNNAKDVMDFALNNN